MGYGVKSLKYVIMGIGEIIQQEDLKSMAREAAQSRPRPLYVAPTFYRPANSSLLNYGYFATLEIAQKQAEFLMGKAGSKQQNAAGLIKFTSQQTAQTAGINVDFYMYIPIIGWMYIPYEFIRTISYKSNFFAVLRFYKTDASGPFYTLIGPEPFRLTATSVGSIAPAKMAAYDALYRELAILKAKHNTLVNYLKDLAALPVTPARQKVLNEGILLLNSMQNQMRSIKGVEWNFTNEGAVNGIGVIPLIGYAVFVIIAGIFALSAVAIADRVKSVMIVNSNNDLIKWAVNKKQELAEALKAGKISQAEYNQQVAELNKIIGAAADQNQDIVDKPGALESFGDMAKTGLYALLAVLAFKAFGNKNKPS
jgi:hypothetical protein